MHAEQQRQLHGTHLEQVNKDVDSLRLRLEQANRRLTGDMDFLSTLFRQAPSVMAVLAGPDHVFELANDAFLKLVQHRPVLHKAVRLALPELDRGNGQGMERRILDFVYQPLKDANGRMQGIFVEGVDVTDHALTEERLRVAQEAGEIGTFEWYPSTGKLVVSDAYRRIWGFSPDVEVTADLLLSRVEPSWPWRGQPFAPRVVNVGSHLRSVEGMIRQTLGDHALSLSLPPALIACVDPAQFEKTVLHLAQNAREAMQAGGWLDIAVDAAHLPGEADAEQTPGYLRVRISDNGAGMRDEVQRRACFGFVRQSGGQVELVSSPGKGTSVSMYFPLHQRAIAENLLPATPPARTVLVVEDEASVRHTSVEVLRKLGLSVLEAGDGETALGMIRQQLPIDLVFTDLVMPGLVRGQDLAAELATYLPQAKLLFASGYPGDGTQDDGILERTHLLRKPYRLDEMSRLVQQLLAEE